MNAPVSWRAILFCSGPEPICSLLQSRRYTIFAETGAKAKPHDVYILVDLPLWRKLESRPRNPLSSFEECLQHSLLHVRLPFVVVLCSYHAELLKFIHGRRLGLWQTSPADEKGSFLAYSHQGDQAGHNLLHCALTHPSPTSVRVCVTPLVHANKGMNTAVFEPPISSRHNLEFLWV